MRFGGCNINIVSKDDILKVNMDERLATLRFICDNSSHIIVDIEKCKKCRGKSCMYFCPANVYCYDEETENISIDYENCLECGTCRLCCPHEAIDWQYPGNSSGVTFRFG